QVGSEMRATTPRSGTHARALLLCDLHGDARPEIVYGTEDSWVYAVHPADGRVRWSANVGGDVVGLVETGAAASPLAVATAHGDLFLLDPDGRKLRRVRAGVDATSSIAVRRSDGACALALGMADGHLLVMDLDGQVIAGWEGPFAISHLAASPGVAGSAWVAEGSVVHHVVVP